METKLTAEYRERAGLAGRRADQCRARIAELRARHPVTDADATRAQMELATARERTYRAVLGVLGLRAQRRDESPDGQELRSRLADKCLVLEDFVVRYHMLGGRYSAVEIDAFAHDAFEPGPYDRSVISHTLWEMEEFAD